MGGERERLEGKKGEGRQENRRGGRGKEEKKRDHLVLLILRKPLSLVFTYFPPNIGIVTS